MMFYKYTEEEITGLLKSLGFILCGGCKRELPKSVDFFAKTTRTKSGFASQCKECKREYDKMRRERDKEKISLKKKEWAEKNKEKLSSQKKEWREKNKEHLREYREKNKDRMTDYNKKYWAENKEESKKRVAEWREANKDKIKQYRKDNRDRDRIKQREWSRTESGREKNILKLGKRRSKKRSLHFDYNEADWKECLEYFDSCCCYCGMKSEKLEKEHFLALNSNGTFTRDNIIPACRSCNGSKQDKDFFEWYKKEKTYSVERTRKILAYIEMRKSECITNTLTKK